MTPIEVDKVDEISDQNVENGSGDIPSLDNEKMGLQLSLKLAKTAPISTDKKCESIVVCSPNPEIGNLSKGPMACGKVRRSVKELKKSLYGD